MKDVLIIVILAVALGVMGYFVGGMRAPDVQTAAVMPTTRSLTTKPNLPDVTRQNDEDAAAVKRQYGMIYGGAGAGIGLVLGLVLTWSMGKKKMGS